MIENNDTTFQDSMQLFDDGFHKDGNPNDNIYGGAKWYSGLNEENFTTTLNTYDNTAGIKIKSYFSTHFATIGPVEFDRIIFLTDSILNPGDWIFFRIQLKNNGNQATAKNISANISVADTCLNFSGFGSAFNNIQPGHSVTSNGVFGMHVSENCDTTKSVRLNISIASGNYHFWEDSFFVDIVTGIDNIEKNIPKSFSLKQNYPNPFNPRTNIQFSIPKSEFVTLKIYNLRGQQVATLVSDKFTPGNYNYSWSASHLASGVYIYKLRAGNFNETCKMVYLK